MKRSTIPIAGAAALLLTLVCTGGVTAQKASSGDKPRLLVLPWLIIDRNTNRECSRGEVTAATTREAQRLARSGQAALDGQMHRLGGAEMIPRKDWEPHWQERKPSEFFRASAGCAVCAPVGELLKFDAAAVLQIANDVNADYVWLGVSVTPLTPDPSAQPADTCCKEALAQERNAVLARSSVLLVRASDGEMVWQRDARRLDADVPRKVGKMARPLETRRRMAVEDTARALGAAFRSLRPESLR